MKIPNCYCGTLQHPTAMNSRGSRKHRPGLARGELYYWLLRLESYQHDTVIYTVVVKLVVSILRCLFLSSPLVYFREQRARCGSRLPANEESPPVKPHHHTSVPGVYLCLFTRVLDCDGRNCRSGATWCCTYIKHRRMMTRRTRGTIRLD